MALLAWSQEHWTECHYIIRLFMIGDRAILVAEAIQPTL